MFLGKINNHSRSTIIKQLSYLVALSEKLLATCNLLRLSWENQAFLGSNPGYLTWTGRFFPPVGRLNLAPFWETLLSEHTDFKILLVTFPLVLAELDFTSSDKLPCFSTLEQTWLFPLPFTQKHLEHNFRVLAEGLGRTFGAPLGLEWAWACLG